MPTCGKLSLRLIPNYHMCYSKASPNITTFFLQLWDTSIHPFLALVETIQMGFVWNIAFLSSITFNPRIVESLYGKSICQIHNGPLAHLRNTEYNHLFYIEKCKLIQTTVKYQTRFVRLFENTYWLDMIWTSTDLSQYLIII